MSGQRENTPISSRQKNTEPIRAENACTPPFRSIQVCSIECLCAIIAIAIAVLIVFQVIARYIFYYSVSWMEEFIRFSFTWFCFLSAAMVMKHKGHIVISFFVELFPRYFGKVVSAFAEAIVFLFLLVMTIFGVKMAFFVHSQISEGMLLPMSFVYVSFPVSCMLMLYYQISYLFNQRRNDKSQ